LNDHLPRKSILVVEDDLELCTSIAMLLEISGFAVRTAKDGAEALERVAEEMPDLILLDMKMPVMNGWEFARLFHERHGNSMPIVVATAAEDARKRAEEIGARASIGKPFDSEHLLAVVRQILFSPLHPEERR
jgi:CheY-like chemotaxis protein